MRRLLIAMLIFCGATGAYAATKSPVSEAVVAIKPDGSITLASSGHVVFAHLLFPDAALVEAWLAEQLLQQDLTFTIEGEDRYGRVRIVSDVARKMLRDGIAILYPTSAGDIPNHWKIEEAAARSSKRGVWGEKNFVLAPENAAQHQGEFHVIEGNIVAIYEGKSATYLNFGKDWRDDFSITVPAKVRRSMKPMLQQLGVKSFVHVRGFIYEENGAMVALSWPDQLEIR